MLISKAELAILKEDIENFDEPIPPAAQAPYRHFKKTHEGEDINDIVAILLCASKFINEGKLQPF